MIVFCFISRIFAGLSIEFCGQFADEKDRLIDLATKHGASFSKYSIPFKENIYRIINIFMILSMGFGLRHLQCYIK